MNQPYVYNAFSWKDQIVEVDEFGQVVYETDEQGDLVYWKDNLGNLVLDPVTKQPIPKPKLLQEGTRHTAARENHQEQGIAKSHQRLDQHEIDILKMRIEMELNDKAPGNSGAFFDDFEGTPNKLVRQGASTEITRAVTTGETVLPVGNVSGFETFTQVTIYDGTNSEDVLITAIGMDTITVQALTHDYVKGARIARSNTKVADGQMTAGDWGNYSVAVAEVV